MLTQTQIDALREHPGLGWISSLRFTAIRDLAESGALQPSLFDKPDLAVITSKEYPGERLVVCYNPLLAQDRKRTRAELLDATEKRLNRVLAEIAQRTRKPMTAAQIGLKTGKIINRHKVAKHFILTIEDSLLRFERDESSIAVESQLDGIYVVRTSENERTLDAADAVRTYKSLGQVEQAFRCIKSVDLHVRPIRHRDETRVRAHIFLCMLAYYVDWHLRKALSPVLFQDDELGVDRWARNPVGKAESSESAKAKKSARKTADGWPVHSLRSLLADMATLCRNTCRAGEGKNVVRFEQLTEATAFQQYVFNLLGVKKP